MIYMAVLMREVLAIPWVSVCVHLALSLSYLFKQFAWPFDRGSVQVSSSVEQGRQNSTLNPSCVRNIHCGEEDSITLSYTSCPFLKHFTENVTHWFNESNHCNFSLRTKAILFGLFNILEALNSKFNNTLLLLRNYTSQIQIKWRSSVFQDLVNKINLRYRTEFRP